MLYFFKPFTIRFDRKNILILFLVYGVGSGLAQRLWRLDIIDGYSLATILANMGTQYGVIAVGEALGKSSPAWFAPIGGFKTSYDYLRAARNAAEMKARAATVAVYLSGSVKGYLPLNAAAGSNIATFIALSNSFLCNMKKELEVLSAACKPV